MFHRTLSIRRPKVMFAAAVAISLIATPRVAPVPPRATPVGAAAAIAAEHEVHSASRIAAADARTTIIEIFEVFT